MLPKLPNDILIKILSINEENNFKEHKKKFSIVLDELQGIECDIWYYFDINAEDFIDKGLSYFILAYLDEINYFDSDDFNI